MYLRHSSTESKHTPQRAFCSYSVYHSAAWRPFGPDQHCRTWCRHHHSSEGPELYAGPYHTSDIQKKYHSSSSNQKTPKTYADVVHPIRILLFQSIVSILEHNAMRHVTGDDGNAVRITRNALHIKEASRTPYGIRLTQNLLVLNEITVLIRGQFLHDFITILLANTNTRILILFQVEGGSSRIARK